MTSHQDPPYNRIQNKHTGKVPQTTSSELKQVKKSSASIKPQAEYQRLQKQLRELQQSNKRLVTQRETLDKEVKDKKIEVEKLEKDVKKLEQQTIKNDEQLRQTTEELSQKKIEQDLLSEEFRKLVNLTKQVQLDNHKHIRNIKETEKAIKETKESLEALGKSSQQLERRVEQVRKEKQKIEEQLGQSSVQDISSSALKLQQEKRLLNYQTSKMNEMKKQLVQVENIYHQKLKTSKELQAKIAALQQERNNLKKLAEQAAESNRPKSFEASQNLGHLFAGDVLSDEPDYKAYLVNILERKTGAKIIKTRLVYRWDPLNSNNFHKYIDGRQQLVVIIKLANGLFLGAWAEGSLIPKVPSNGEGLIFSLSHQQCFQLLEAKNKATVYDEYYLIFGNSQLRIHSQSKSIFSNFGVNNSFYKNRGFSVEVLFGESGRETEMETFQIFEMKLAK